MGTHSSLLDTLLISGRGSVVQSIAQTLRLGESETRKAISSLAPAFSKALQGNTHVYTGMKITLGEDYKEVIAKGNSILGEVFGSKHVSRVLAGLASQETGVDFSKLKKMLPMIAVAAVGSEA